MKTGDRVVVHESDEDRTVPDGTAGTVVADPVAVGPGEIIVYVRIDAGEPFPYGDAQLVFFADELKVVEPS